MSADNPRPRGTDKPAETGGGSLDRPAPEAEIQPRKLHDPRSPAEHSADVHSRPPIPGYNPFATDGNYIVEPGHEFDSPPADRRATPPVSRHPETTQPQTQPPELSERAGALHPSATPDTPRHGDAPPKASPDHGAYEHGADKHGADEQRWAAIERRIMASVDQLKAEALADGRARFEQAKAEMDAKLSHDKAQFDEKLAGLRNEIREADGKDREAHGKDREADGKDEPRGVDRPDPTRPAHPDIPARYPADYKLSAADAPLPQVDGPHVSPENWVKAINPRDPSVADDRARWYNCAECARATDGTWQGYPKVAGVTNYPAFWGEPTERMEEWAGTKCKEVSMTGIEQELNRLGPGSSGLVAVYWTGAGGHWFNAVNDGGTVKAVDGQSGRTEVWPPTEAGLDIDHDQVEKTLVIYVKPDGKIVK